MGQWGILNGEDVLLNGRETFCGEGKGLCSAWKGMQAKDGAGYYSERSEGARNQFRQIVARDIFHHFAAAAGQRAIRKSDGNADDEVPERAEAQPQRAAVVGGENAADGCAFAPHAVEGQPLAMLRQRTLQRLQSAAGLGGNCQIRPGMVDGSIEPSGRKDKIHFFWRISPVEFCGASTRDNGHSGFIRQGERACQLVLVVWFSPA